MTDDRTVHGDDAPPTTWKAGDATAATGVTEAKPGSLTGPTVTINRPVAEVFACFRNFANLPRFMENVARIDILDDRRSHWVVKAPAGRTVEWNAVVTDEVENRSIGWMSEPGADVENSGRIEFRDAGQRGTIVTAVLTYDPPAGIVGKLIAKMFQREPAIQARRDLRRFKQWLETGEIATNAMNRTRYEEEAA